MKIKKVSYKGREGVIIYITLDEKLDDNIDKKILDLRKKYKDVAVFISGRNSIEKALEKIIQENR